METIKGKIYDTSGTFVLEADFSIEADSDIPWIGYCVFHPGLLTLFEKTGLRLVLNDGREGSFIIKSLDRGVGATLWGSGELNKPNTDA